MQKSSAVTEARLRVVVSGDTENIDPFSSHISDSFSCQVVSLSGDDQTLEALEQEPADIVLIDLVNLKQDVHEFIARVRERSANAQVLVLAPSDRMTDLLRAMRAGASDYLFEPYNAEEATLKLERAMERVSLITENRYLKEQVRLRNGYGRLLGAAPAMQKLYRAIIKVGASNCPVLIQGESGTGKELVARTIHENSAQSDKPFVPIDCAAIPAALFESELFGHVRGAFTGASRDKQGLLATADAGVIFLDEIGELPIEVQAKLLRALQEHEVRPVGGNAAIRFEARVLAATNRDLSAAVQEGRFRSDLFYRLNVVTLKIPPLRERKNDIPLLVEHFLRRFSPEGSLRKILSEESMNAIISYDWPGNVRELENCIQRAVALSSGPIINFADLPTTLHGSKRAGENGVMREGATREVVPLADLEKEAILRAVEQCGGDKLRAARMLGIGKTTLYRKLKEYGRT